jgi:hypothetical protein
MRTARLLVPCTMLIAATACSAVISPNKDAPAPEPAASRGPSTAATLKIPPGHLPPPGQCRVWVQGLPPGKQPKARGCSGIEDTAPPSSWVVYRPGKDKKVVHVREMDSRRVGIVVRVTVYDVQSGSVIRGS